MNSAVTWLPLLNRSNHFVRAEFQASATSPPAWPLPPPPRERPLPAREPPSALAGPPQRPVPRAGRPPRSYAMVPDPVLLDLQPCVPPGSESAPLAPPRAGRERPHDIPVPPPDRADPPRFARARPRSLCFRRLPHIDGPRVRRRRGHGDDEAPFGHLVEDRWVLQGIRAGFDDPHGAAGGRGHLAHDGLHPVRQSLYHPG